MENLAGKQLGAYRVVSPLGEGGMAAVYKAYQAGMDRYVALKVLPQQLATDPQFVGRFKQEAQVLAKLQHPHILPVFDYGEAEGYTYIVMPFVESGTLTDLLKGSPLPLAQIRDIASQVGDALDYAHSLGLVHRDVKPSNVLVDKRGNCLLTDFGIAKIVEGGAKLTNTGGILGTPAYMSPEQGRGDKVDARTDVYALGVMLYEMAVGRVPFDAETPIAIVFKHIQDPLPMPSAVNPGVPDALERVILKALAKAPEERFQTAGEMVRAVRTAIPDAGQVPGAGIVQRAGGMTQPVPTPTGTSAPASYAASGKSQAIPSTPSVPAQPQNDNSLAGLLFIGGGLVLIALCILAVLASLGIVGTGLFVANRPTSIAQVSAPTPALRPTSISPTEIPVNASPTVDRPPATEPPQEAPTSTPARKGIVTQLWSIGSEGTGPGFFDDARYIAVDGAGNVYVGEHKEGSRVQVFDSSGKFVTQWRTNGDSILTGLAADQKGVVYVLQGWDIYRYDGATGDLLGQVSYGNIPDAIAATVENELVIVSDEEIVRFDAQGQVKMRTDEPLETSFGESPSVNGVAVDGAGNIYVVNTFIYSVFKFSPQGKFLDRIGSEGEGPGKLGTGPESVAVDGQGRIYVSEFDGIEVFDPDGNSLGLINVESLVFGMVVNTQNELITMDRNAAKLTKYALSP